MELPPERLLPLSYIPLLCSHRSPFFPTLLTPFSDLDSSLSESILHVLPRSLPFFDEMDSPSEIVSKTWDIFSLVFAIGAATITNITFDANNWILIALEIANISFEIHLMLLSGLGGF